MHMLMDNSSLWKDGSRCLSEELFFKLQCPSLVGSGSCCQVANISTLQYHLQVQQAQSTPSWTVPASAVSCCRQRGDVCSARWLMFTCKPMPVLCQAASLSQTLNATNTEYVVRDMQRASGMQPSNLSTNDFIHNDRLIRAN